MKVFTFFIVIFSVIWSDDRTIWGCHDLNATNYNPWSLFDCADWCCEYDDNSNSSLGITINEINYNPPLSFDQNDSDYEFIELFNSSNEGINMNGWYLSIDDNSCFTFPDISIEQGGFLILARNPQTFDNSIGIGIDNALSNSGGTITLRNPHYDIIDEVHYNDTCDDPNSSQNCWPINSDAGGSTLELIDSQFDNALSSSWQDSFVIPGGTPGFTNSVNDGSIYGCTDILACNYSENATADNGTCIFADGNFDCDGNCLVSIDCNGICGGDLTFDECGVCEGEGIEDGFCDCSGNILDCNGICGGDLTFDECGVCGGEGIEDGFCDCLGNILDCNGNCGGSSEFDICGECDGTINDIDLCPISGYKLSFANLNLDQNSVDIILNNENSVAGFQFLISGINILNIELISLVDSDFTISSSESTIIGFSLSGQYILPMNGPIFRIFFDELYGELFCIEDPIFSSPNADLINIEVSDCLNVGGCTDLEACNFGEFVYSCENCCDYGSLYWLDADGDGLGYANDEYVYCEDPGFPWVQNHGDDYPNCFSNFVDSCGICDGDNSTCSGCIDELAFNSNCLNGNWPDSAVFGCNDEVIISDNSCIYHPEGFDFNQSTAQSFYKFIDASFNDASLVFMGSWIGAFKDDECVGSWPWVGPFTMVPLMGDDGNSFTNGYMLDGEIPDFYIYDPVTNASYEANISDEFPWVNFAIYHVDNLYYNADCENDENDQVYDECNVCGGDGFIDNCLGTNNCIEMDCLGVCGGDAVCESDTVYGWNNLGYILGDVNFDNSTNVVDITNQVNFILDNHIPNFYEFWASDMNQDFTLNVVDIVSLSGQILGLLKSNISGYAIYSDDTKALISDNIGGIQYYGELSSIILGDDILVSNQYGKSIIYNLNGLLETKEFIFKNTPIDLLTVDLQGQSLNVEIVSNYTLGAYPNPFNPTTTINFAIPADTEVSIAVYNLQGREVVSLASGSYDAGYHSVIWNADTHSSGVYFVKMMAGSYINTQKLMLVK